MKKAILVMLSVVTAAYISSFPANSSDLQLNCSGKYIPNLQFPSTQLAAQAQFDIYFARKLVSLIVSTVNLASHMTSVDLVLESADTTAIYFQSTNTVVDKPDTLELTGLIN